MVKPNKNREIYVEPVQITEPPKKKNSVKLGKTRYTAKKKMNLEKKTR